MAPTIVRTFASIVTLLTLASCGEKPTITPNVVAGDFLRAVRTKDYEKALSNVLPEERKDVSAEDFGKELERELAKLPPIPEKPNVLVEVDGKKAKYIVENWSSEAKGNLVFRYERWWIGR